MVANLGVSDHRITQPAVDAVYTELPFNNLAGALCGNKAAHHVPAILGFGAAVEHHEFVVAGGFTNGDAVFRVFRGQHQCAATCEGGGLDRKSTRLNSSHVAVS